MKNELKLPTGFSLRLMQPDDDFFLRSLFNSTRPEFSLLPLPQEQLEQLLRQQYEWQQKSYAAHYPHAECWMIEVNSVLVGKIMLTKLNAGMHIIDFIITPEWRGRSVGRTILGALQSYVDRGDTMLSLNVDRQNSRAKQLYQLLGFTLSQSTDTHECLVWSSSDK